LIYGKTENIQQVTETDNLKTVIPKAKAKVCILYSIHTLHSANAKLLVVSRAAIIK